MGHIERNTPHTREMIEKRQEREAHGSHKDETEYVVHTRSVDHSVWIKTGYYLDKYRALWYLIVALLVALGFEFKTPAANNKILHQRIDAVIIKENKAESARVRLEKKVDVLINFRCLEATPRDLQLVGLSCVAAPTPQLERK